MTYASRSEARSDLWLPSDIQKSSYVCWYLYPTNLICVMLFSGYVPLLGLSWWCCRAHSRSDKQLDMGYWATKQLTEEWKLTGNVIVLSSISKNKSRVLISPTVSVYDAPASSTALPTSCFYRTVPWRWLHIFGWRPRICCARDEVLSILAV